MRFGIAVPPAVLAFVLLGACAGQPRQGGEQPPAAVVQGSLEGLGDASLSINGTVPMLGQNGGRLFDSRARVRSLDGYLQAETRFHVESGDAIDPEQWSAWQSRGGVPSSLGRQVTVQQLESRIPVYRAAPLRLAVSQQQETRYLLATDAQARGQRQAELSWAPAPASMSLRWTERSGVAPGLLDCGIQGALELARAPDAVLLPALQLGGRSCEVFSTRMPAVHEARSWSAALLWPQGADRTSLRVMALEPVYSAAAQAEAEAAVAAAYELGLAREQQFGHWKARGGVAVRRGAEATGNPAVAHWQTDAAVTRSLLLLDVSASYRAGVADDWFLPVQTDRARRLALDFDFSPWLALALPLSDVGLSLSYQWLHQESALGEAFDDAMVQGRIRWSW